jgi:hypothetical protein
MSTPATPAVLAMTMRATTLTSDLPALSAASVGSVWHETLPDD